MKKSIILASLLLSSFGASAGVVTAGGIQWDDDPIGPNGVSAQVNFQQWFTNSASSTNDNGTAGDLTDDYQFLTTDAATVGAPGTELVGIGEFYSFSDGREPSAPGGFCVSGGCELTFAFGGLFVNPDQSFDNTNAWINIYIDETPDFNSGTLIPSGGHSDFVDAQDGTLWASFDIDLFDLDGNLTGGESELGLSIRDGVALADVEAALEYSDVFDILFTSGATFVDNNLYTLDGNGQLINAVPEPTGLALFSLGLLGLAGVSRKKKA